MILTEEPQKYSQQVKLNDANYYCTKIAKLNIQIIFFGIQTKRELQQAGLKHSSLIVYKNFTNLYKLASDISLHFRKIILKRV